MTPKRGPEAIGDEINALKADVAALKAQLRKPSGGAGALAPGFNAFGMAIGTVEGYAPPINVASPPAEPPAVVWTKVKSDDDLTFDGARLQMPSDGLFMIFLNYAEVWARRTNRAGASGTLAQVIEGGNMAGAVLFASSAFGTSGSGAELVARAPRLGWDSLGRGYELVGGMLLAYGNAVSLGLTALYFTEGRPPGVILPTRINVTAEVHRLIEG